MIRPGPITFDAFVQRVRRHRVNDVLNAVAQASIALTNVEYKRRAQSGYHNCVQQWSLAAVAKASIVSGNDHRSPGVSVLDLTKLCMSFVEVEEPILLQTTDGESQLSSFMVRLAYEQFPHQFSIFEELGRTQALLGDAAEQTDQDVISPEFWEDALGCSLTQFVGLGLLLNIGALQNGGYYDPSWLGQANFRPILDRLPRELIERVAARHLLATRDEFRQTDAQHRQADRYLRRYEFNPLVVHPFVEQPDGRYMAPIPRHALTRSTPTGLYYIGLDHGGTTFTTALGPVFEHYVGMQLKLLSPEVLLHDVEYGRGLRSADWVAVLPKAVLIVEAKATPLSESARLGGDRLESDLARAPGKALRQIDTTVELIIEGHVAFKDVPDDRPIVGLVATLEPYLQCNSDLVWHREPGAVPVLMASSRELEALVSITDPGADEVLLDVLATGDKAQWNLGNAIAQHRPERNSILDRAWETYPFSGLRDDEPHADTAPSQT